MSINARDIWNVASGLLGLLASALSDEDDKIEAVDITAAMANAGSVIADLMTSVEDPLSFRRQVVGAIKIQLATLGINGDAPPAWIVRVIEATVTTAEASHHTYWSMKGRRFV